MCFDGLIFDLDGTLWDCAEASARAFNYAYQEFGILDTISTDFVRSISGIPWDECDEILLSVAPPSVRVSLSRRLNELEIQSVKDHAPHSLYPDVADGLTSLLKRYKLYLVSNCAVQYIQIFLAHSGIGDVFRDWECFGRTQRSKGENIRALIERESLLAPCYIGDTAGDEAAAAQANIPFFHAAYGFGHPRGVPHSFRRFLELTQFFMALPLPAITQ